MTERPIICNTETVQLILSGRKTQMRPVIKPQPLSLQDACTSRFSGLEWKGEIHTDLSDLTALCPYGHPGDLLYVRETWSIEFGSSQMGSDCATTDWDRYVYRATAKRHAGPWKSPVTMPKTAARLWLRVRNVRVERLQEISEQDAIAEGAITPTCPCGPCDCIERGVATICEYSLMWLEAYEAKKSPPWKSNPWVWVIEFERVER